MKRREFIWFVIETILAIVFATAALYLFGSLFISAFLGYVLAQTVIAGVKWLYRQYRRRKYARRCRGDATDRL